MTAIIIIVIIIIVIIVVTMAFTSQHFIYAFIQSLTWCKDTVCLLCGQLLSIFVEKKAKHISISFGEWLTTKTGLMFTFV